jgi:hypothetical protein
LAQLDLSFLITSKIQVQGTLGRRRVEMKKTDSVEEGEYVLSERREMVSTRRALSFLGVLCLC